MKAGRELDAKIAEKVFPDKEWLSTNILDFNFWEVPAYSTDIKAAWLVVEKMNLLVAYQLCQSHNASKWLITHVHKDFDDTEECWLENYVCADTAPEAICLTALKIMEAENE